MFKKILKKREQKKEKGFTIIEVMIVLAIAGLIMAVVLVAVPQLQRNQRDSAKRDVVGRLSTEFGAYAANNSGQLPTSGTLLTDFITRYVGGVTTGTGPTATTSAIVLELKNPKTGNQYQLASQTAITTNPGEDSIFIYPGATCNGENASGTISANSRVYALRALLERTGTYTCVDNN